MADFKYGPVELYLVGFEGVRPDRASLGALSDLIDRGIVSLLDFVIVSRSESGEVDITEVEFEGDDDFAGFDLGASGLVGESDVAELAEHIPPGTSAALLALELTWARTLASAFSASGGVVLRTERIPAPIVNAIVDAFASAD